MTALETKIIKLKARVEKLEYIMKYLEPMLIEISHYQNITNQKIKDLERTKVDK